MALNRFQRFHKKLEKLGYNSYSEYLQSEHWKELKDRYMRSKLPKNCRACGSFKDIQFHHRTYKDLGNERTDQLIAICGKCHKRIHDDIKLKMNAGNWKWNLWQETKKTTRRINRGKGSGLPTRRKSSAMPPFIPTHTDA